MDRSVVHLDHGGPWNRNLQRQDAANRPTPSLDAEDLVLRMLSSPLANRNIADPNRSFPPSSLSASS